ncbi:hypothetical protein [Micromonospora sp. KC723]|uniref:hypothetical protein n=1 Tax=Micromonospora sp. KC723 TaxID=2530381 RepID=UPI00104ECF2A|nr:hypothetical protein [Micromonospora sp. KC723]TDB76269.1 hypothetical protein E1165_07720 [Micromonospora sp. KC723]
MERLSIGRLAADLGVSESGLCGYLGSKVELQLVTIRSAAECYERARTAIRTRLAAVTEPR